MTMREWAKANVVKWRGSWNSDAKCIDGGYLFLRQSDGTSIGRSVSGVSNRAQAIEKYYKEEIVKEEQFELAKKIACYFSVMYPGEAIKVAPIADIIAEFQSSDGAR